DSTQRAVNSYPPAVRSYQRNADGCELERASEPRLALAQGGGPKFLGVAMSLHDKCRQRGRELNEISLVRRRRSSLAVIQSERAEQSAGIVDNRHRPAGPEAVRQRDRRILGPKVEIGRASCRERV